MRIDKKLAYPANLIRALKTYEIYYRFTSRLPDLSESMILDYLENYTAYLTDRERAVLKLRFEDKLSSKDAGKKLPDLSPHFKEVSGGRITQIEDKAIGKLRRRIIRCEDKKASENEKSTCYNSARLNNIEANLSELNKQINTIITCMEKLIDRIEALEEISERQDEGDTIK